MKKTLLAIIFALLIVSLVACGTKENDGKDTNDAKDSTESVADVDTENPDTDTEAPETGENTDADTEDGADSEKLLSESVVDAFFEKAKEGMTAEEIANEMVKDGETEGYVVDVMGEDSYFMGFGNAEITGYAEAARFAPMIGTIPFMAYIFILDDGADSAAFTQMLLDNCNPRWNICTEADTIKAEQSGNAILFLMCQDHPY